MNAAAAPPLKTTPPCRAACARCGRPLLLPFVPRRPKLCDSCYAPRPKEEIDGAFIRRELTRRAQKIVGEA